MKMFWNSVVSTTRRTANDLLTATLFLCLCLATPHVRADGLPAQLLPSAVDMQDADKEVVAAPAPGLLLIPHGPQQVTDEKYKQRYHAACYVYVGELSAGSSSGQPVNYIRRFVVHAPETDSLPLVKRAARCLLLLYGLNTSRLRTDHPFHQSVDVWLSGQGLSSSSPDAGGEQFKNQIYIFNIFADRRPVEWVRELAHEYGHYILPGVSGFKAPEEWANGVLGERLFLRWMNEEIKAGKIKADDIPFAKQEDIAEYVAKQDTPLIQRIARDGITESAFAKRDAGAMDLYTGLALYSDAVNGTSGLNSAFSYTTPKTQGTFVQAPDFLRGVEASLRGATDITYTCPLPSHDGKADFWIYLPRGEFAVSLSGSATSWIFASDARAIHPVGGGGIIVNVAAWRKLTLRFPAKADAPARFVLHRKGAEVE